MIPSEIGRRRAATIAATALLAGFAGLPASADAAAGFGPLSGVGGCLVAPGSESDEQGTKGCAAGKGLAGAKAVAVSPDGANVYVVGGVAGNDVAMSFGAVVILKRDAATGAITETGCLSSDGTDGRDGASGACAVEPSLLGARGVAVSPDGSTVFVSSSSSASVVAFSRDPASGVLTRLGCFQGTPRAGAPCGAANLLASSSGLAASADGSALYVAAPLEGAISTLDTAASLRTPNGIVPALGAGRPTPTTSGSATSGSSTVSSASGSASPRPLAAIFTASLAGTELLNPCIAVNGLDGVCAVGTATQGLGDLALSPDGKQLYGAAPGSKAIDVFTPETGGALAETGCVKVDAPPGLCSAAPLINEPSELATSPDGKNVYAADSVVSLGTGRVDVLSRNSSGALSTSACVEYQAPPPKPEPEEEGEEEGEAKKASAAGGQCASAPGLNGVSVVAVSGDGSSVYAIGSGSAAIFSRNPVTGDLTEASCAVDNDERCTSLPALSGVTDAAVSPDGREVYVVASRSSAVMVFGVGAAVTTGHAAATSAGMAKVSVACPAGLRNACTGRVDLTRAIAHVVATRHASRVRVRRLRSGHSGVFSIEPGHHATVEVSLTAPALRLLASRRRLRVMAVVHAAPAAGGSGYGRRVLLALGRR